jgi:hypothetical protein
VRRLTILLATVGALLLVPAAQAFANAPVTIHIKGSGSGEVSSTSVEEEENVLPGEPLIECNYESPGPATGTCNDEASLAFEFYEGIEVYGHAAEGSKLLAWEANWSATGEVFSGNCGAPQNTEPSCFIFAEGPGTLEEAEITATFCLEGQTEEECLAGSSGPTNKRTLTLTKGGTGAGAVKSKPKGIACGSTCSTAVASLYKESSVVLSAKAATGANLEGWTGCDSSTNTGLEGTCTVKMTEARNVKASFGGTVKAIVNPQNLTLTKVDNGFSTGYGTVKGTGLACEADCTTTTSAYFGGETSPPAKKAKAAALVTLTALASPGSEFVGWSGCESEPEGKCVVSMSSAKNVEAEFKALPKNTLTLTKVGAGAVKSKPKGVACSNTCTGATASLSSDTTIVLSAKAATGSTLTSWEGCASSTNTGTEGTCTVSMSTAKAVKATFTAAVKALVNPQTLTLTKAGSGYGTVKATGLACEVACISEAVQYFGGEESPPAKKAKAPTTVTLTAISAPGSKTVVWSGCDEEKEGNCIVAMSEAKNVTAAFDELE